MNRPYRYSTIQDFYKCPAYYKYKNIDGLSDGGEKSGDMAFGTCIHAAVQDLFEGGDGFDVFRTYWSLFEAKDMEYSRLGHGDLDKLGSDLLEVFRDEHMKHFVPAHLEKKLTGSIGDHPYSGTVDFLGTYRGAATTNDWKTAAYPYDAYKIQVNEQLYGYAHLAEQKLGFQSAQVMYSVAVKDPKNPRWQFKTRALTPELMKKKLANILVLCNTIQSTKEFYKNPGQCVVGRRICPFFERCHGGASGDGEEKA